MGIKLKKNLKEFESIIKVINKVSDETDYIFTKEGIRVSAVDPSSTYIAIFKIDKSMFEEYEIEEEITITLQNDLFTKLIKKVGKKELNFDIKEDAIELSNPKEKFSLKFFVGQKDERPEPQVDCTSIWKMKTAEFTTILNELSSLGVIGCLDGKDELTIKIKSNMVEGETITSAEKIQSEDCYCYYDMTYFAPLIETKNIFTELRIGFGEELPCVIKGTNDYLNFAFVLAARVE